MGALCSSKPPVSFIYPDLKKLKPFFSSLNLSENDIERLHDVFNNIDPLGKGRVLYDDLLYFLELDRTPFNERVLCMFDNDQSGMMDFLEFVMTMWNYCTFSKEGLGEDSD